MTVMCPHCGTSLSELDRATETADIEFYDMFSMTRATVTVPCAECQGSMTMNIDVLSVNKQTHGTDDDVDGYCR